MKGSSIYEVKYLNVKLHYHNFAYLPGFVLLESIQKGRFDILSAYPYDKLSILPDTEVCSNLFYKLEETIGLTDSEYDFPFQGGAIGFFTYDLATKLANLHPKVALTSLPLVEFRFYDWALIVDHDKCKAFFFAANTQADTQSLIKEMQKILLKSCASYKAFVLRTNFQPLIKKNVYFKAFQKIQEYLKQGRCYQVNLTYPNSAAYEGDEWTLYQNLKLFNPVPYGAFLRSENFTIISFSPEQFLQNIQGKISTAPIKGTIKRSLNITKDQRLRKRLFSPKNISENVMIVDLWRNDLGKIAAPGSVHVNKLCELQSFSSLHHLVSTICAEQSVKIGFLESFAACFPGGSVTGAPKLEAMRVISELEPYDRGLYCGSLGYISKHRSFEFSVVIRTLIAQYERLYLNVGGAILKDSDKKEEYQESILKGYSLVKFLSSRLRTLPIFDLGKES